MIVITNKENLFPPLFHLFFLIKLNKTFRTGVANMSHIDPPNPNPLVVIVKHVVRPPFLLHHNAEKNLRN